MKDTQIQSALDSMFSGLDVSADLQDKILNGSVPKKSQSGMKFSRKIWLIVIIALLISAVCGTSIGMPMLRIFKKWDPDTYMMQIDMEKPMPGVFTAEKQSEKAVEVWGPLVTDTLFDFNVCTKLPEWKPERYTIHEEPDITLDETFGHRLLTHYVTESGDSLRLSVWVLPDDGNISVVEHIQHDEKGNEIWKFGDVEYVLLKNYEYHSLNWQENNCTIKIHGIFDRDEALKMVKSIYE